LLGFGLNSMGNHYNPLSISIVNSESIDSITTSWKNTAKGLYGLLKEVLICNDDECNFCCMLREQIKGEECRPWLDHLESDEGLEGEFPVDKPASYNSKPWFSALHQLFGIDIPVQQCSNHTGCELFLLILAYFITFFQNMSVSPLFIPA
jgi:hypothetical protein